MKKSWTLILGLMAGVFVACTPAPAKGFLAVTINGLPSGATAGVTATSAGGTAIQFTATDSKEADVGTYTITAADVTSGSSTYTGTASPTSVSVSENATATVTVTYALKSAAGSVNPAKTFTSPIGIGSLAFITGSGASTGRLYASSRASSATDIGGRLFLEPADITGAGSTAVAVPGGQIVQGTVADPTPLVSLAFNASGLFYQIRKDARADFQTPISRYPRTTAVSNNFADEQFVITNGFFNPTPSTSDRTLVAPADMAFDSAGNLWVVDPSSNARNWRGDVTGSPAGRLVCYSAADQSAAATTRPTAPGQIGTPGAIYFDGPVAGARTISVEAGNVIWIGSGTGASAKLSRITGLSCPNLPASQDPAVTDLSPLPTGTGLRTLSGANLVGPVDMAISGSNILVAQSNGTTNNILSIPLTATTLPATTPIGINGMSGNINAITVDASNKTWVGTAGASGTGTPGRIYQLP